MITDSDSQAQQMAAQLEHQCPKAHFHHINRLSKPPINVCTALHNDQQGYCTVPNALIFAGISITLDSFSHALLSIDSFSHNSCFFSDSFSHHSLLTLFNSLMSCKRKRSLQHSGCLLPAPDQQLAGCSRERALHVIRALTFTRSWIEALI